MKQRYRALEETEDAGGPKQFIYLLVFSVSPWCKGLVFGCGFVALRFRFCFFIGVAKSSYTTGALFSGGADRRRPPVLSSLSQAKGFPSMARFSVLNSTAEKSCR